MGQGPWAQPWARAGPMGPEPMGLLFMVNMGSVQWVALTKIGTRKNMGSVQWVALTKIGTQKKHGLQ